MDRDSLPEDKIVERNCCNPAVINHNTSVYILMGHDPTEARNMAVKLCREKSGD